nr:acetyl-CoA carboxylase biotin carboxyl carrier protein subunit [Variovorax sp. dw_308]
MRAGISGTVIEVVCEKGTRVEEGDPVVFIEAMKMEMPEVAPCSGEVVELFATKGQVVPQDFVIALIRPD